MRSGLKNCRVKIYRLDETADPKTNAAKYTPVLRYFPWATAQSRRGREVEVKGQIQYESYVRFEFDYLDVVGISPDDYIEYEGVQYSITGLLPDLSTKDVYVVDAVARPRGSERA